jgi:protein gp37/ParB-like chromosome segregation protein Spo0J
VPLPVGGEAVVKIHPVALLFPKMSAEEFTGLVESIRANGLLQRIVEHDGQIVDGRNRFEACKEAGVEPRFVKYAGKAQELTQFIIGSNLHRRHLTESQRALIAAKLSAESRKGRPKNGSIDPFSVDDAAKALSVGTASVKRARKVLESGDVSVIAKVERGESKVSAAAREIRERAKEGKDLLAIQDIPKKRNQIPAGAYSIATWNALSQEKRSEIIANPGGNSQFNKQDTEAIDWAKWSWNPVTGCRHNCPYCYARDIAERFYEQKFEPTFLPDRLGAPARMSIPNSAKEDVSYRNVFTCSMADLFGRWVPSEWIQAVLDVIAKSDDWNFLFLTKFPKRYAEFRFPNNAWIGTTVDCQARVESAEKAMAEVRASVKWLSIEPMIEPLSFSNLAAFQWIVIGGASRSSQTPEWRVPSEWWAPLHAEAAQVGVKVYHKTNLYRRSQEFPWQRKAKLVAPKPFQYLKGKTKSEIVFGEES